MGQVAHPREEARVVMLWFWTPKRLSLFLSLISWAFFTVNVKGPPEGCRPHGELSLVTLADPLCPLSSGGHDIFATPGLSLNTQDLSLSREEAGLL